ncbi:MAG: cation transporter [Firmicutes bacterium]|nr:cation transporter [Bacillota bacterium]
MAWRLSSQAGAVAFIREGRFILFGHKFIFFLVLMLFWLVITNFSLLGAVLGVLTAFAVVLINRDLLDSLFSRERKIKPAKVGMLAIYSFSLLWQIVLANLQLARIVLDPKLPVQPGLVTFNPGLKTDLAKTLLANSITLTPGTLTIAVEGDTFVVHALTLAAARDVVEWRLIHLLRRIEEGL